MAYEFQRQKKVQLADSNKADSQFKVASGDTMRPLLLFGDNRFYFSYRGLPSFDRLAAR